LIELHVRPIGGSWMVALAGGSPALSWHRTASEAELAARRHAAACGAHRIYLHDAYHRVRGVAASLR
jgi:hypothetical protein